MGGSIDRSMGREEVGGGNTSTARDVQKPAKQSSPQNKICCGRNKVGRYVASEDASR